MNFKLRPNAHLLIQAIVNNFADAHRIGKRAHDAD